MAANRPNTDISVMKVMPIGGLRLRQDGGNGRGPSMGRFLEAAVQIPTVVPPSLTFFLAGWGSRRAVPSPARLKH